MSEKQILSDDLVMFLESQGAVIVSTLDDDGSIHCSAKGVVGINKKGTIYLIDLYHHNTYKNLKERSTVTITSIDEHKFLGWTLQGKAKIVPQDEITDDISLQWEKKIVKRITNRIINNVQVSKKNHGVSELHLPEIPKYLIEIDVNKVINLRPVAVGQK